MADLPFDAAGVVAVTVLSPNQIIAAVNDQLTTIADGLLATSSDGLSLRVERMTEARSAPADLTAHPLERGVMWTFLPMIVDCIRRNYCP